MDFEAHKSWTKLLGLIALSLVWGTQFIVIKWGQSDLPPLLTAALRFAVLFAAAQIVVIVTRAHAPLEARLRRASFGITQAVAFGALYWAQGRLPSALAGVLSATSPFLVALLAHRFVAGERLKLHRSGALALGFLGTTLIVWDTRSASGIAESVAVIAILLGELASASNKVLAKRLTTAVPAPVLLRDMGFVVTVSIGLASFCLERDYPIRFSPASVMAFIYLGLIASFLASTLYLVLLRTYAVTAMAYLQFAVAAVAAVTGVLLGGEKLGPSLSAGLLAILAGLLLLSGSESKSVQITQQGNDE